MQCVNTQQGQVADHGLTKPITRLAFATERKKYMKQSTQIYIHRWAVYILLILGDIINYINP